MKGESVQSVHPCESVIQTIYDIVKAHGGELCVRTHSEKVVTKAGEGSEFIILFPIV